MNDKVLQHYRKTEQPFIDQVFSWIQVVADRYTPTVSPFVTPREWLIAQQIVATQDEVRLTAFGGYGSAERQRLCLIPDYYEVTEADFDLSVFEIKYAQKFAQLSHGTILGSVLGSGIERNRIGDIITDGERWHMVLDRHVAQYVQQSVTKMGNVTVRLEEIDFQDMIQPVVEWETKTVISSSLRLDTLLAKVYNFSRQRAKEFILAGAVKVNHVEVSQPDFEVAVQDVVSLRRYGRFQIQSNEGATRKENIRLIVNVLIK